MPAVGRNGTDGSNLVDPNSIILPVSLRDKKGSISWNVSFEQFPSGTITYESIGADGIEEIEREYALGTDITITNYPMIVSDYDYTRNYQRIDNPLIEYTTYTVTISLEYKWQERITTPVKIGQLKTRASITSIPVSRIASLADVPYTGKGFDYKLPDNADKDFSVSLQSVCQEYARVLGCYVAYETGIGLKTLGNGGSHSFAIAEIISDGSNRISLPPYYNGTKLTWGSQDKNEFYTNFKVILPIDFQAVEPAIEETLEENPSPSSPPSGDSVLRDLSSNFDQSARKKTRRRTTTVNGSVEKEEIEVWGYAYTSEDIDSGDGVLLSHSPSSHWKQVRYELKTYEYTKLPSINVSVEARNPTTQETVLLTLHPDYEELAENTIGGSNTVRVTTNAEYLTAINTTGWILNRFRRENGTETIELAVDKDTDPLAAALYNLYQFKKIPLESKVAYLLQSTRSLYDEGVGLPFSIDWQPYDELPRYIQTRVVQGGIASDGRVGLLIPDPNYVEPLTILEEQEIVNSYLSVPDPESDPDVPLPDVFTGEETRNESKREIKGANQYSELSTQSSAQNAGFEDSTDEVVFRRNSGRPPEATTRTRQWETVDRQKLDFTSPLEPKKTDFEYYITSDYVPSGLNESGDSIGFERAESLAEAKRAAEVSLQISEISENQIQKTVAWHYPGLKIGDFVEAEGDRFAGILEDIRWLITRVQWQVDFNGDMNELGLLALSTTPGTQITGGLYRERSVSVRKESKSGDNNSYSGSLANVDFEIESSGAKIQLGEIVVQSLHRRKL